MSRAASRECAPSLEEVVVRPGIHPQQLPPDAGERPRHLAVPRPVSLPAARGGGHGGAGVERRVRVPARDPPDADPAVRIPQGPPVRLHARGPHPSQGAQDHRRLGGVVRRVGKGRGRGRGRRPARRGLLADEGAQRPPGPHLHQHAPGRGQQRRGAAGELHGAHQVAGPVAGIHRLRRREPGARHVGEQGDARGRQPHPPRERRHLLCHGAHERRVEGVGGGQAAHGVPRPGQPLLGACDGLFRPRQHAQLRRVDGRQRHPVQVRLQGVRRQRHGQHGAAGERRDGTGTQRHQLQGVLQPEHAGHARGRVLAQGVAGQGAGAHAPRLPQPGQRVAHDEDRRLRRLRPLQARGGPGNRRVAQHPPQVQPSGGGRGPRFPLRREEDGAQVEAQVRPEEVRAAVHLRPEDRLGPVQPAPHPRVLVSHPGKEEDGGGLAVRHPLRGAPGVADGAERGRGLAVAGHDGAAVRRTGSRGRGPVRPLLQLPRQARRGRVQRLRAGSRHEEEPPGAGRGGGLRPGQIRARASAGGLEGRRHCGTVAGEGARSRYSRPRRRMEDRAKKLSRSKCAYREACRRGPRPRAAGPRSRSPGAVRRACPDRRRHRPASPADESPPAGREGFGWIFCPQTINPGMHPWQA